MEQGDDSIAHAEINTEIVVREESDDDGQDLFNAAAQRRVVSSAGLLDLLRLLSSARQRMSGFKVHICFPSCLA
jgi:hypothetical protein